MKEGKYYGAHLHMHSCFEGTASMEGHMYEAQRIGVDVIWFTDHDSRMGIRINSIREFDFEKETLLIKENPEKPGVFHGWISNETGEQAKGNISLTREFSYTGMQCMKICAESSEESSKWQRKAVYFTSNGKRHQWSLLSIVRLKIACLIKGLCKDTRIIFKVKLSQRPPDHQFAAIKYVIGESEGLEDKNSKVIPLKTVEGSWCELTFNLTKDAENSPEIGGLDNVFDSIEIIVETRNGKSITCFFDDFQIQNELLYEDVRVRQKALAERLGAKYGVLPIVATEISNAGMHKNCFSTNVPIINYMKRNYSVTHDEAIQWVLQHNGTFSYNHPFVKWNRLSLTDEEKESIVKDLVEEFTLKKCDGASMIEIGFPVGRYGFSLENHLELWDGLSANGIFITGHGVSDNHANDTNWYDGNNFVAWIYSDELNEESLIKSMKSGNVYTGDPVQFKGELIFETKEGYCMGQVVKISKPKYKISLKINKMKPGWTINWIVNGENNRSILVDEDILEDSIKIEPKNNVNFVRVEVYNESNRCILLTNPIYFVTDDNIPDERRVTHGTLLAAER